MTAHIGPGCACVRDTRGEVAVLTGKDAARYAALRDADLIDVEPCPETCLARVEAAVAEPAR